MAKNLNDFVKDNSKFLRLQDGETFEGTYVGYKVTTSTFDPDKETVVYKLRYEDGKEVYFQTGSTAVASIFSKFKGGERVKVKREGTGTATKYKISSPAVIISQEEMEPDDDFIA